MYKLTWLCILSIALSFSFLSCKTKKKYYYREGSEEEQLIEAESDSIAYLDAYQKFEIAKKVYNDMKESYGSMHLSKPVSFVLLNENREEITDQIVFADKDSLEASIAKKFNEMPNNIKNTADKIREEKHGAGAKYDTGGLYLAPVKVLSAKFVNKEYSNYKDVALKFKNVSSKTISAIRFKWYGENAFNEPADMSGIVEGWGGGFTDDALRPGKTDYGEWSVLSKDGKKILIAYPYEVAFNDGTKWELKQ